MLTACLLPRSDRGLLGVEQEKHMRNAVAEGGMLRQQTIYRDYCLLMER